MFNNSPESNNESCALEIKNDGIAYARIYRPPTNQSAVILKECAFYNGDDTLDQLEKSLNIIVNKYNLTKEIPCNWVLYSKYYRLLLANTPNVPVEEYKNALRWQIKDMVDYPHDDIAIDTFMSASFSQIDPPKLYVVASQSTFLQKIVEIMNLANLNIQSIDIKEFAIRNLINLLPNEPQPVGFLHINSKEENECLFIIVKDNQLHFIRHIPLTTDAEPNEQDFAKISEEIQKSLDYYSAELKQDMPKRFLLSPAIDINSKFATTIKQSIALPIASLPLANIVQIESGKTFSNDLLEKCYIAIGGALRKNET